jgi:hypothetical protein
MERDVLIGVISALSALGGVVVSQFFSLLQAHFEHKHQKKILLRTKYEELARHLNEAMEWVSIASSSKSIPELHARSIPTAARWVYSLSLLYFPELKESAVQLVSACSEFQHVLIDNYTESEVGSAGGQAARKSGQQLQAAARSIVVARTELDAAIQKHAGSYAAA